MIRGVMVTYERPADVRASCRALLQQSHRLDELIVVDNSAAPSIASGELADLGVTHYEFVGENSGPAGGLARGLRLVLREASPTDWILLLDDDDPVERPDELAELVDFAERSIATDPAICGVGRVGARLDRKRGRLLRPGDHELGGVIDVDYIGGGQLPLYRAAALEVVGVPDEALFFGFEELEFGLRFRRAGFRLCIDGPALRRRREERGRLSLPSSLATASLARVSWRTYYSRRNLLVILLRERCYRAALYSTTVALAKPLANMWRTPRRSAEAFVMTARATLDGLRGRLGRRVEPV